MIKTVEVVTVHGLTTTVNVDSVCRWGDAVGGGCTLHLVSGEILHITMSKSEYEAATRRTTGMNYAVSSTDITETRQADESFKEGMAYIRRTYQ